MQSLTAFPESLSLTENDTVLQIVWSDNHTSNYKVNELRAACPCAMCKGHHPTQSLNLKAEQFPDVTLTDLAAVGRYAYNLVFSDNHSTGIYPLKYLRELDSLSARHE